MSFGICKGLSGGTDRAEYLIGEGTYADEVLSLTKEIEGLLQEQAQYDENYRAVGSLSDLAHQYSDFTGYPRNY